MLDCVACKEKRNINLFYFTYFYMILYDFINCPAFVDIKQTYKLVLYIRVNIIRETFIFYTLFFMFFSDCFA